MIRVISPSTFFAVSSLKFRCVDTSRPKKTSAVFSPYTRGPNSSLIPHLDTIFCANSVACSKSFDAPVVI